MKHIGDDELTDEMFDAKTGTDMVPMIKSAMKRLNIKEEVEEADLDEARQLKDKKKEMMVKSKTSGVIVIDKSDFEKYKKKGYFQVEGFPVNEAKYDIYHKTFSGAMQHAYAAAKKMYGITVDPKEIDNKVATGSKKPSSGKTNKYRLKGDKGSIQVQVANLDNKKYELNMYKEELEEGFPNGDGGDVPAMELGTDRYLAHGKEVTPGENTEEGAAADARRAIGRDKDLGRGKDSADDDDDASDDDVKAASKNIIMQMRKVISLRGNFKVQFGNGKKEKLDPKIAQAVQSKYNNLKRPAEKEKFQKQISKSKNDLLNALKESLEEGKMKELHGYIQQGKSAKEIAKLMKVDVKTITQLMSSYSVSERTLFKINSKIKERKNG